MKFQENLSFVHGCLVAVKVSFSSPEEPTDYIQKMYIAVIVAVVQSYSAEGK